VEEDWNAFAYILSGRGVIGADSRMLKDGQLALLGSGDRVHLSVPMDAREAAEVLLVAGQPLGEPVARYGPFVMNTEAEIRQALVDYQSGTLGEIQR
ncbi:MAG: pirin-like C-terminal cupin domain-containing protein, partial [bacterium]